jgi:competence protein ComK
MEKQILTIYEINNHTLALLPAYHPDYDAVAIEPDGELKIRKPPLAIIQQGCLEGGASYVGRRDAVKYLTGAKNKVPIPVNPHENIYAFPTHSPKPKNDGA